MEAASPNACPLPIECIELILDELGVDTFAQNLYPLLTVSKLLFRLVAKRLYADPIKTIESCDALEVAYRGFAALVFRHSPCVDDAVQQYRLVLCKMINKLPAEPYCDYLSLVKSISAPSRDIPFESGLYYALSSFYRLQPLSVLIWATCSHRLSSLHSLAIPFRGICRYIDHIDQLKTLRSIQLYLHDFTRSIPSNRRNTSLDYAAPMSPSESELSLRLDVGAVYEFLSRWNATSCSSYDCNRRREAPATLELIASSDIPTDIWLHRAAYEPLTQIIRLCPTMALTEIQLQKNGLSWLRFVRCLETIDLSRIKVINDLSNPEVDIEDEDEDMIDNDDEFRQWPVEDKAIVLQQCKSLTQLHLVLAFDDQDIFAWTEDSPQSYETARSSPIVPVKDLRLRLSDTSIGLKPFRDALHMFRQTLQTLWLKDGFDGESLDLSALHDLPGIANITIHAGSVHDSGSHQAFSECPNLLQLDLNGWISNETVLKPWTIPSLRTLRLQGSVGIDFDHVSLSTMPQLTSLDLGTFDREELEGDQFPLYELSVPSWSPQHLKILHLQGPFALGFSWKLLKQCHVLTDFTLDVDNEIPPGGSAPTLAIDVENVVLKSVVMVGLRGWNVNETDLFQTLPTMFPRLAYFSLATPEHLTPCTRQKIKSVFPHRCVYTFIT